MAEAVYILCALTSIACAVMLIRGYLRNRARFLLWSSLCFTCLAVNNLLLFVDRVVFPERELDFLTIEYATWRTIAAITGLGVLLFGLIWDAE